MAVKAPPDLEEWSDIGRADKMARRAAGLDKNGGGIGVNIGLQLVNQRILQDDLPLDAVAIDH
jgi:hypothetical protein